MRRIWRVFLGCTTVVLLTSCSGGDDDPATPSPTAQSEATTAQPSATSVAAASTATPVDDFATLVPTIPPPLEGVEFSDDRIEYPAEWPDDLRYPDEFELVEAATGPLPNEALTAWTAKHRFEGGQEDAIALLTATYMTNGWESTVYPLDSGGALVTVTKRDVGGTGTIILDSDQDDSAVVLLTTVRL